MQKISGHHKNCTRMLITDFVHLLNAVGPKIGKQGTKFLKAILVQE